MSKFNLEKLNEIKDSRGLTFKEISQITNIPISTVSKIFGGFNNNPTLDSILKIASALDCGIDDFVDYETEPKSPYYIDRQTIKISQIIYENNDLKNLLEICKNLEPDDIKALIGIAKRIKV